MSVPNACAVWRVTALATPAWCNACPACGTPNARFSATDRFRVNANGSHLDVWLLYACEICGATRKRRLLRRAPVASIPPERLDAWHRNDSACAWSHAFEVATHVPLPYRLERPPLRSAGLLLARIEQPFACGLRWDRFLAVELGRSRVAVVNAWRGGVIAVEGIRSLADRVDDGALLRVTLL